MTNTFDKIREHLYYGYHILLDYDGYYCILSPTVYNHHVAFSGYQKVLKRAMMHIGTQQLYLPSLRDFIKKTDKVKIIELFKIKYPTPPDPIKHKTRQIVLPLFSKPPINAEL